MLEPASTHNAHAEKHRSFDTNHRGYTPVQPARELLQRTNKELTADNG